MVFDLRQHMPTRMAWAHLSQSRATSFHRVVADSLSLCPGPAGPLYPTTQGTSTLTLGTNACPFYLFMGLVLEQTKLLLHSGLYVYELLLPPGPFWPSPLRAATWGAMELPLEVLLNNCWVPSVSRGALRLLSIPEKAHHPGLAQGAGFWFPIILSPMGVRAGRKSNPDDSLRTHIQFSLMPAPYLNVPVTRHFKFHWCWNQLLPHATGGS